MTQFPFELVAFDLDGTMVDTGPDLTASLNHALVELGRPRVSEKAVRDMVGLGAAKLLERGLNASGGFNDELMARGLKLFLDYYAENVCVGSKPYPGVERALDSLSESGCRLAICTNKPIALSLSLIEALGWQGRFAANLGGDSLEVRKPDPLHLTETILRAGGGSAAFVGDSIVDVQAARAANVPIVAVSFGFSDRPATELGADALIDHFDQLEPALMRVSASMMTSDA